MTKSKKIDVFITQVEDVPGFNYEIKIPEGTICAYDFDGIFCQECPKEYKGSEELYLKFLQVAQPLYYPHKGHVTYIVTGRHFKYRDITEDWLKKYNITFDQMIMRDFELDSSDVAEAIGNYKAKVYDILSGCSLFIESRFKQASLINKLTKKPVFCPIGPALLTEW